MNRTALASMFLAFALGGITQARADETCVDFKWDVTQERALYAGTATTLAAGTDTNSAPAIQLGHLYELKLMPQDKVTFAVTPGKRMPKPGANAGIVTFKLPASGSYRVAIDMPFWIDVVSNGALVTAKDFQAQHDCSAPHKIVEFDLAGTRPLFLQLSNAAPDSVRVTITAAPARKL
jgi:hypothetical protein